MSSRKILVADYNTRELQRLKKLFSSQGYDVVTVQDGKMALDTFSGEQPDIVLLSAMLSKVNGFDVCKQIKASVAGKNVPVIIMTAVYKGQKYRVKAIHENKASEFLEKPVEDDVLLETVSRFSGDTRSLINKVKEEMREEEQADHKAALLEATPPAPEPAAAAPVPDEPEEAPVEEVPETTAEDMAEEDQKTAMIEVVAEPEPSPTAQDDSDQIDRLLQAEISSTLMATQEEAKPSDVDDSLDQLLNKTLSGLGIDVGSDKPVSPPEPARPDKEEPVATEEEVNATLAVEATLLAEPDTAELKFRKLEEDVIQEDKEELGKQAVENLLNSFDTDLEKKLSDTLSGVGLSDTNIEKVMDAPAVPEEVEATPEEEDKEGTKFGDYVLIEKIGHGGMAELFKAKKRGEQGFQKILAIKRILPHLTDNQELVTMFIDEAKIAAQLTHQNIASIFDFGKIENSYYIAMEFVDGFDLRKVLSTSKKEGIPIPHKMAVYIALQIASALDYAHHKKDFSNRNLHIVHRDVSPQNILISKEGEVKLLDFGISKAESKIHHTVKGALKGKLLYMSPEQAWGKSVEMQSDLYSLGIVLFEMVSGKVLFEDSSEFDVLEKVRSGKIPLLDNERKNLPPRLKTIVDKALQIEAVDRYQDAGEMAKDLHDYLSHGGPVPTPKDLAAFLTRLYPENFNLSPGEVRHLGFAEFMEQPAPTRAKALSEDTVLMAAEEMEGLEILSPESSDAEATTVAPVRAESPVSDRPDVKKATSAPEKKEPPAAKAAAPSPKKSGKKKDTSRQTPASKVQEKKESKNKSVSLSPPSSQVEPPLFGGAEEKKSGSKVTLWAAVAVVVIALGVAAWVFLGGNQGGTAAVNPPANVTQSNPEPTTTDQAATPASETGETPATTPAGTDQPAAAATNPPTAQATPDTGRSEPQRTAAGNPTTEKTPPVTQEATTRSTSPETPAVHQTESKTPPVEQAAQNPPPAKEAPAQTTEQSQPATKTPPAKITEDSRSESASSREAEAKPPEVKTPPPAKEAVVPARKQETPPQPPPAEKKAEEKPKPKAEMPKPSMPVASGSGLQMSLPTQQQKVKEGDTVPLSDAKPPVLVRQVPPRYPETARNLKLQGSRLICRILVSHTGDVDKVVVVSAIPTRAKAALAGAAERALSQWKYKPATKDGVRVKVWTTITLAFN